MNLRLALLAAVLPTLTFAAAEPPQLDADGLAAWQEFVEAPDHRAFAIAPGGAWGRAAGAASAKAAEDQALANCRAHTRQTCVLFASDDRRAFDAAAWPRLWGTYATAVQARQAAVGRERGERMADLAFSDARGGRGSVSALKGKAVVLHFWGAWCGPCRKELPEMQRLAAALTDRKDIAFVLLQAREKFAASRRWAEAQGLRLPLHDSGSTGEDDAEFRLAGGGRIRDRDIAARFPTTYVLDKRGVIVFAHVGPVHDWTQYEAFLRDVAARSGR